MTRAGLHRVLGRCGARRRIAFLLLSGIVAGPVPVASVPAPILAEERPTPSHPHAAYITEASRRFGIPEIWIVAVLDAESRGDAHAVSPVGAMGLMQLMPDTWAELRIRHRLGDDPFDVRDNILAGTAYLREMLDRYGGIGAMLAAYNAGPGRYDEYLATGRPLPAETRDYVATLAPILGGEPLPGGATAPPSTPADWREAPLFVARFGASLSAGSAQSESLTSDGQAAPPPPSAGTNSAQNVDLFVPVAGTGGRP